MLGLRAPLATFPARSEILCTHIKSHDRIATRTRAERGPGDPESGRDASSRAPGFWAEDAEVSESKARAKAAGLNDVLSAAREAQRAEREAAILAKRTLEEARAVARPLTPEEQELVDWANNSGAIRRHTEYRDLPRNLEDLYRETGLLEADKPVVWDGTPERATAESLLYQELGLESGINPTPEERRRVYQNLMRLNDPEIDALEAWRMLGNPDARYLTTEEAEAVEAMIAEASPGTFEDALNVSGLPFTPGAMFDDTVEMAMAQEASMMGRVEDIRRRKREAAARREERATDADAAEAGSSGVGSSSARSSGATSASRPKPGADANGDGRRQGYTGAKNPWDGPDSGTGATLREALGGLGHGLVGQMHEHVFGPGSAGQGAWGGPEVGSGATGREAMFGPELPPELSEDAEGETSLHTGIRRPRNFMNSAEPLSDLDEGDAGSQGRDGEGADEWPGAESAQGRQSRDGSGAGGSGGGGRTTGGGRAAGGDGGRARYVTRVERAGYGSWLDMGYPVDPASGPKRPPSEEWSEPDLYTESGKGSDPDWVQEVGERAARMEVDRLPYRGPPGELPGEPREQFLQRIQNSIDDWNRYQGDPEAPPGRKVPPLGPGDFMDAMGSSDFIYDDTYPNVAAPDVEPHQVDEFTRIRGAMYTIRNTVLTRGRADRFGTLADVLRVLHDRGLVDEELHYSDNWCEVVGFDAAEAVLGGFDEMDWTLHPKRLWYARFPQYKDPKDGEPSNFRVWPPREEVQPDYHIVFDWVWTAPIPADHLRARARPRKPDSERTGPEKKWGIPGDEFDGTVDMLCSAQFDMEGRGKELQIVSMCVNWVIPPSEVDLMEMCLEGGAEGVEEVLAGQLYAILPGRAESSGALFEETKDNEGIMDGIDDDDDENDDDGGDGERAGGSESEDPGTPEKGQGEDKA